MAGLSPNRPNACQLQTGMPPNWPRRDDRTGAENQPEIRLLPVPVFMPGRNDSTAESSGSRSPVRRHPCFPDECAKAFVKVLYMPGRSAGACEHCRSFMAREASPPPALHGGSGDAWNPSRSRNVEQAAPQR